MKNCSKIFKATGIFVIIILTILLIFQVVYAFVTEPGSEGDPIITKSYIDQILLPSINEKISQKVDEITSKIVGSPHTSIDGEQPAHQFVVVEVKSGQKLIAAAGTELILRMGKASIIATEKGGLADVTQGADLQNGMNMPANHLLIVPMDDGRGILALTDLLVMVKGNYVIK